MGVCASDLRDSVMISRDIDKRNEKSHKEQRSTAKLLLLGAGESGKSTLFKQLMQSFGKKLLDEDRYADAAPAVIIFGGIIRYMGVLCCA